MQTRKLRLEKALSPDEVRAVLAAADRRLTEIDPVRQRAGIFAWVALTTGLRVSEIARLRLEWFDLDRKLLKVYRHKKHGPNWCKSVPYSGAVEDVITLPDALVERIRPISESLKGGCEGPLFLTAHGRRAAIRTLFQDWAELLWEAGVSPRGCHAARHTFGTLIAVRTRSPFAVRDALGHSDRSIAISAQYVERNPELVRETLNSLFQA
ncbi:hypothetical protein AMJ85_11085 [candidate division BRC1 bacterium SM23_51]|nr:MAG: hypothetical protein AMJ85_11085 [candidate division BRC1 bacterium SM23_51]